MIVKMSKYAFMVFHKEYDTFLSTLRDLGVVHIKETNSVMDNELSLIHILDDNTFFKTFDIESVFAYLLKLEMIERWVTLDKARGEKTFRELVGAMKMGSENALEEFKRNNIK